MNLNFFFFANLITVLNLLINFSVDETINKRLKHVHTDPYTLKWWVVEQILAPRFFYFFLVYTPYSHYFLFYDNWRLRTWLLLMRLNVISKFFMLNSAKTFKSLVYFIRQIHYILFLKNLTDKLLSELLIGPLHISGSIKLSDIFLYFNKVA